ncbi:MAG: hypothetical protein KKF65_06675 [Nanoarchaeota archaeon]|nr:hypothetical protein [Nanoarchaeota archaeon]
MTMFFIPNIENRNNSKKLKVVLNELIDSFNIDFSKDNSNSLEENVLEIMMFGKTISNGLLMTNNGYFFMPKCFVGNISYKFVRYQGKPFGVEKVCFDLENEDLALLKANMDGESKILNYDMNRGVNLAKSVVRIIEKYDNKINIVSGLVESVSNYKCRKGMNNKKSYYPDDIFLVPSEDPKFLGSPVIDENNKLVGLYFLSDDQPVAISLNQMVELLSKYRASVN